MVGKVEMTSGLARRGADGRALRGESPTVVFQIGV
jgi:hypothetical protein